MHQLVRPRHWPALLFLVLLLAACGGRDRRIQPVIPTPDAQAGGPLVLGQPMLVSFTALNDDASANLTETQFRNQLIRVTGAFVPGEPLRCGGEPRNGPVTSWALVAENLRLEVAGLEEVVELIPEGTQMTVEGYWRVYEGPVGCGKEPPAGLRFYLDARQIIAPNPLPIVAGAETEQIPQDGDGAGQSDGSGSGGIGTPAPPQTPQPGNGAASFTPTGQVTVFVTPTRNGTGTATATATPSRTATGTPALPGTGTPGATPTPSRTGTPTLTSTPGAGPTPSPTNTPLGQATPEPTSTGGAYPGPTPSATPTATPGY